MLRYCPYCETTWDDAKQKHYDERKPDHCKTMGCGVVPVPDAKEKLYNRLISDVMDEIEEQIGIGDIEGVIELLTFIPTPFLIGFLDEERWEEFRRLKGVRSNGAGNLSRKT